MLGKFGSFEFGSRESTPYGVGRGKRIACVGDMSDHGGTIVTSNDDNLLTAKGDIVAVEGALHSCPQLYWDLTPHGVTSLTAVTVKTYHNGKLILTKGAIAGCGAVIKFPPDRRVDVE